MRLLPFGLLAVVGAGCDAISHVRLSNIPTCQTGQVRECNRPDGDRGQQICGLEGYWTTSCDPRDASSDVDDAALGDAEIDADPAPTDAGTAPAAD